jgi:hypothetical protein
MAASSRARRRATSEEPGTPAQYKLRSLDEVALSLHLVVRHALLRIWPFAANAAAAAA